MRIRYIISTALPNLSWCARIRKTDPSVTVCCGKMVETRNDGFVEGAWDGSFSKFDFLEARTFCGSGGMCVGDAIAFASSTHTIERLYSMRTEDSVFVSNSLAFLLTATGDAPIKHYPYYFADLLGALQLGVTSHRKIIRTEANRHVTLHDGENIIVYKNLSIERKDKPIPYVGKTFESYVRTLSTTLQKLISNAIDDSRSFRYSALSTISKGYDSPAVSVLAKSLGCKKAITFRDSRQSDPDIDSGEFIGRQLGMSVSIYDRYDFRNLPGIPEAEFMMSPNGIDVVMAPIESELFCSFLLNGRFGDTAWGTTRQLMLPNYQQPSNWASYGTSMLEYRLRVGFLQCPVPYIAARDLLPLYRISKSEEMRKWSVPGSYNRPIPRRIIEEAGIDRGQFGEKKMATAFSWGVGPENMSIEGYRDYTAFLRDEVGNVDFRYLLESIVLFPSYNLIQPIVATANSFAAFIRLPILFNNPVHQRYKSWPTPLNYCIQWGFSHVRSRYIVSTELFE